MLTVRQKILLTFSLLLPLSGFAEEVDTVQVRRFMENAFLLTKYTGKNDPDTALLWTFYFGRDREDMLPASRLMVGVSIKL